MKKSALLVCALVISIIVNIYYIPLSNSYYEMLQKEKSEDKRIIDNAIDISPYVSPNVSNSLNKSQDTLSLEYFNEIFRDQAINLETEQFTIVIMTYKRAALLRTLIPHYCGTGKYLDKLLIVWNDVGTDIPRDIAAHECDVPLVFLISKANKLTNRFIPYMEIKTKGVFIIDDDRNILHEDIIFAFQSWQQFRHKVLGFEHRTHTILSDGTYYYGDKEGKSINHGYSLLISANIILHKKYLEMFQVPLFLPNGIHKYINEHMNCEDIAICLMVTDFLERVSFPQSGCISLRAKQYPQNLEAKNRKYNYK